MTDDTNAGVDPRFDPAFQRGFDTSIPIEEYVPEPAPRKPVEPIAAPPVAAPVAAPPRAELGPTTVPTVAAAEPVRDVDDDSMAVAEPDASAARNPFLLFLGIISVALIVAGIWLFIRSGDAFNSKEVRSQGDYMSLDSSIHSAPFIALLGAATAIGILFVLAARWRRRR